MTAPKRSVIVVVFALMLVLIGTLSAQAAGYYYRWAGSPPGVSCLTLAPGVVQYTLTNYGDEYDMPAGAMLGSSTFANGALKYNQVTPMSGAGANHIVTGVGVFTLVSYPLTVVLRYDTIIDGNVVYRSDLTIYCSGDGTGTAAINNEAISGGGSAINDGRINPENYAPVALYCDGSTLTAYAIDAAGQGTQAWSLDLSQAPSSSPLSSADGISLTMTGDGRYAVQAAQHDGKQYLFIFDGCPAPGATETYVSDPTTGEFVRTE